MTPKVNPKRKINNQARFVGLLVLPKPERIDMHTNPMRRWIVRQGASSATVKASDIDSARRRAAEIGFKAPQSIALVTDHDADRIAAQRAYRALHG